MTGLLHTLGDFVTPPLCPICGKELAAPPKPLCASCVEALPLWPDRRCRGCGGANDSYLELCRACQKVEGGRPWRTAVSALPYHGKVREAIHGFKYRSKTYMLPFLATQMASEWHHLADDVALDAVTYIPLHWRRYLQRGYNQAEMLAEALARTLDLPCIRTLRRRRMTSQQARLQLADRKANMRNVFAPVNPGSLHGLRLLLVDDVFTTGTTLGEATQTLLKAGAAEVSIITAARD